MSDLLNSNNLQISPEFEISQPLWQRVPTRTAAGEATFDFMMIITRLNRCSELEQNKILAKIYPVLHSYSKQILLADLNVKMNLLWISYLPRQHLGIEIAARIHDVCPIARLISHRAN